METLETGQPVLPRLEVAREKPEQCLGYSGADGCEMLLGRKTGGLRMRDCGWEK